MSAEAAVNHYLSAHQALEDQLSGTHLGWLNQVRRQALSNFQELGFPSTRQENWKYTRVTAIQNKAFQSPGAATDSLDPAAVDAFALAGLDCHRLVFVDGCYIEPLSSPPLRGKVTVSSLGAALHDTPELVETHLGQCAPSDFSGFSALNTAFVNDGVFVHLQAGAVIDQPLLCLFISSGGETELLCQPRLLLVAEADAKATVIEKYAALEGGVYFNNAITEVVLGENASLEHYKLQTESDKAFHVATLEVRQGAGSRFVSHSVSLGARLARNDINSHLSAHAVCELYGLYMAHGRQHMDYHTRIDHAAPHGTSKEFYKGVLDGHARGVFNGQVHVHPDAQKTDAEQSNNNLLLSRNAEVDTKPQLEIYADDVKCSHGATVGQLDDNMIFYLRSRGIDAAAARGLLTYGFASEVLDQMELAPIREALAAELVAWLPNAEQVRELVT